MGLSALQDFSIFFCFGLILALWLPALDPVLLLLLWPGSGLAALALAWIRSCCSCSGLDPALLFLLCPGSGRPALALARLLEDAAPVAGLIRFAVLSSRVFFPFPLGGRYWAVRVFVFAARLEKRRLSPMAAALALCSCFLGLDDPSAHVQAVLYCFFGIAGFLRPMVAGSGRAAG